MKVNSSSEVLDALSDQMKALQGIIEFWDPHMVRRFPAVFGDALRKSGVPEGKASEIQSMIGIYLKIIEEQGERVLYTLRELTTEIIDARSRSSVQLGEGFKV